MSDAKTRMIARMVARAAREITPGMLVNLGIGLPTKVVDHLPAELEAGLHTENGLLGVGPTLGYADADRDLIDAGGAYISTLPGGAFLDSSISFAIVRSGRLDLTMLGAFEIAQNGDLANWKIPGKFSPGAGGGIELAQKAKRVVVLTTHTDRKGQPKLLKACSLPLTARSCVSRIFTDMAVVDVTDEGFCLSELAEEANLDDVISATGAPLIIPEGEITTF